MHPLNEPRNELNRSRRDFLAAATSGAAIAAGMSIAATSNAATQQASSPAASSGVSTGMRGAKTRSRECPPEIRAALTGPWPTIRTPFTRGGEIDFEALRRNIDFLIQAKSKAIVLTWGDSLFSLLTDDEIAQITKAVVQCVNRRAFVVTATGIWWTGKAVEFAKYSRGVGADMLMVLPPDWAQSTTLDTLADHYRVVAEHIPVMVVTNFLTPRGIAFGLELCGRLHREAPGVFALKDDFGGEFIRKVCLMTHDRWALSAGGQKQNHLLMQPYGVDGYLSTFMNFKPEIAWRYWKAIEVGNLEAARDVVRDYDMPLFDYLIRSEGGFDAGMHGLYELFGLAKRYRRLPYYALNDKQMDALAEFLRKIKILDTP